MPTYDYVCTSCGHAMEVMHTVHGDGPAACPRCGARMRKAIAPLAVHFKGTGWARKERSPSRPAKAESKAPGSSEASAGGSGAGEASAGGSGAGGSPDGAAPKDAD